MRTNVGVTIYGIEFRAIAEAAEHFGVSKTYYIDELLLTAGVQNEQSKSLYIRKR